MLLFFRFRALPWYLFDNQDGQPLEGEVGGGGGRCATRGTTTTTTDRGWLMTKHICCRAIFSLLGCKTLFLCQLCGLNQFVIGLHPRIFSWPGSHWVFGPAKIVFWVLYRSNKCFPNISSFVVTGVFVTGTSWKFPHNIVKISPLFLSDIQRY